MRDWENLRYFLAVARKGTVSAAAKELAVSHSTVLRRIEQFEAILGSKLFKKLQRGYELTAAGERLYSESQNIEQEVDRVLSQAEGHHDVTQGKLRISQPELGIINIYPLYAQFKRLHPEITLEIQSTMEPQNINQMEVDIVLRFAENPSDLLVGRCLGTLQAKVYASKSYLKQLPRQHTPDDYEWISWQVTHETKSKLRSSWLRDNVINPNIVLYTRHMPDVVSAVVSGMGVGLLSSHVARQHSNLVELYDGVVANEYKLWLLTHRDLRNSERVKTFMRFMSDNLKLE